MHCILHYEHALYALPFSVHQHFPWLHRPSTEVDRRSAVSKEELVRSTCTKTQCTYVVCTHVMHGSAIPKLDHSAECSHVAKLPKSVRTWQCILEVYTHGIIAEKSKDRKEGVIWLFGQ